MPKIKKLSQRSGQIIIITGGIASGKSFVTRYMQWLGFKTFHTDEIVKNICNTESFNEILQKENGLTIDELRDFIEKNPKKGLDIAEKIIHPIVRDIREDWMKNVTKKKSRTIVMEIPLFFEITSKFEKYKNAIIISTICGIDKQLERAKTRNISQSLLEEIINRQCCDDIRKARSNIIIPTYGNKMYVRSIIQKFIKYGTT